VSVAIFIADFNNFLIKIECVSRVQTRKYTAFCRPISRLLKPFCMHSNKTRKMANQNSLEQKVFNLERIINSFIQKEVKHSNPAKQTYKKNKTILKELSDREIDVLKLICEEHTNQVIGDKLFISKRTVEGHRQRILEKVGAKNTVGLVVYAIANGIYTFFPSLHTV
jgi:DNA-binding CsgD family transcriptional regulator